MRVTKTKIIATIGPSTNEYSLLKDLHAAGMNVARLNMSHASQTDALKIIELINKVNKNQSKLFGPIGVLLDTQGPEIRTGINQSDIDLKTGDIVNLTIRDDIDVETSSIKINYKGLIRSVDRGSKISIDNGLLNFQVLAKDNESLKCKVLDGGTLGSKRHVNLPGVRVDLPSITKKDRKDINFAIKNNVSFIALSFVRSAQDILNLRSILKRKKSSIKIIAKIENQERNLEEIILELEDKLARTFAEMENQRRRFEKEKDDAFEYGGFAFAKEALNLIDNLARSKLILESDEALKDTEALKKTLGHFDIINKDLISIFTKNNIKPIDCLNKKLDPNLHQAMMEIEDDQKEPGTIVQEVQKGFMIKDRLLRPSLVGVSKKTENKDDKSEENKENLDK